MTIARCGLYAIFVVIALSASGEAALPSTITACSRNLRPPEPCLQAAVDRVQPLLALGDLGDGFHTPPMEPLAIDAVTMSRGSEFNAMFSDLLVNGPSKFVVEKLKADIPNLVFDFSVLLPRLNFTGKYQLKLKLLLLNLQGKGIVTGQFKNARADIRLEGKKVKRPAGSDSVDYVSFHMLETKIHIPKAKFHLDNLFNGEKTLNEVGNQFVNENSDLFVAELIPGMEKSLSKTFLEIVNIILKDVTFDEMFPDT